MEDAIWLANEKNLWQDSKCEVVKFVWSESRSENQFIFRVDWWIKTLFVFSFKLMVSESMVIGWFYFNGEWKHGLDVFTLMVGENMVWTFYLHGGLEHGLDVHTLMVGENMVWTFYLNGGWEHCLDVFTLMVGENMVWTFYLDGGWEHGLDVFTLMVG